MTRLSVPVTDNDHAQGRAGATVTLLEYGDYECPYCGEAYPIVKKLQSEFGNSLRFVFRNLPLSNVHPHALHAAEVAEAVGLQGPFWQIHDLLYENQSDLEDSALVTYAEQAGADAGEAIRAATSDAVRDRIQADVDGAIRSGANGTPTFFVNGLRYDGSWELAPLRRELSRLISRSPGGKGRRRG
jgi:protein-disulfide isomerase